MDQRASAFWVRLKANRLAYSLTILVTLTIGILGEHVTLEQGTNGRRKCKTHDIARTAGAYCLRPGV